jgi:ketopantoate reductase
MARNILILGASYGSLLATKLLMAGHNVTLVCRKKTAELINRDGTEVRIKLRDEAMHRRSSRATCLEHWTRPRP